MSIATVSFCILVIQNQRGTKTVQNHGKIKSRTLCPKYPLWNTSVSFAKVQICPLKNEGKSLFLSFTTHFPTIVLQMWLLQAILTSNSMACENRVLNFVLHSVGHFQKRDTLLANRLCRPRKKPSLMPRNLCRRKQVGWNRCLAISLSCALATLTNCRKCLKS